VEVVGWSSTSLSTAALAFFMRQSIDSLAGTIVAEVVLDVVELDGSVG
jgi:hypothetical protein